MALTTEEEQQRIERAGIAQFEARFVQYMQQRAEQDQRQITGRQIAPTFDIGGDLNQQRNEKREQIRTAFRDDVTKLERQNKTEIAHFENWMKEQRQLMRAADGVQSPQQPAPQHVPSFAQVPFQNVPVERRDKDFPQREKLRDDAAKTMQDRFAGYQSQQHEKRTIRLNERDVQNIEKLDVAYGRSVEQKAQPEKKLKRFSDETDTEFAARAERAAKRAHETPKLELKPNGPQRSF